MSTDKTLRAIASRGENRKCFNCGTPVQYVVPSVAIFVCTECSGHHMNIGHRVKSISMGKFTAEEVAALDSGGNAVATRTWLASWKSEGDAVKPVDKNPRKLDAWVRTVFLDKRYYSVTPVVAPSQSQKGRDSESQIPVRPLSDVLGSGPGSVRLTVSPTTSATSSPAPTPGAAPAKPPAGPAAAAAATATVMPSAPKLPPTASGGASAPPPAGAIAALKAEHPERPLGVSSFGWPAASPLFEFTDNAFGPGAAAAPAAAASAAAPAASAFDPFGSFVAAPTPTPAPAAASQQAPPAAAAASTNGTNGSGGGGAHAGPAGAGAAPSGGSRSGGGAFPAAATSSRGGVSGGGGFTDDVDWGNFNTAPSASGSSASLKPAPGQLPRSDPPPPHHQAPAAAAAVAPPPAIAPNSRGASGGGAAVPHPQQQPQPLDRRTELPSALFCEPVPPLGVGVGRMAIGPVGLGAVGIGPMGAYPAGAYPGAVGFGPMVGAAPPPGRPQMPYPGPGMPVVAGVGQFAYAGLPPSGMGAHGGMVPTAGVAAGMPGMSLAAGAAPAPMGAFAYPAQPGMIPVAGAYGGGAGGGFAPNAFNFGQMGAALPQPGAQSQQLNSVGNGNPFA